MPWNSHLQLSALMLAIAGGMLVGNLAGGGWIARLHPGIKLSQQKLLRLGIVLYGIRLTVQDLFRLGPRALALDVTVIACVLLGGYWIGTPGIYPQIHIIQSDVTPPGPDAAIRDIDSRTNSKGTRTNIRLAVCRWPMPGPTPTAASFLSPMS